MDKVKKIVQKIDDHSLAEILAVKRGVFGYTPLHDAAATGKTDILKYLLERTNNAHVNFKANGGYTPLHVAVSSGNKDCVKVLLHHSADFSIDDEFGKTPKQIAKLNNQNGIARILICEGE